MRPWRRPVRRAEVRWPWYLAVDVSQSMQGKRLQVVEETLPSLLDVLGHALVDDAVRLISMLEFADDARLVTPLDVLDGLSRLPGVTASGGSTSFGGLFGLVRELLTRDVQLLHADGYRVLRPVVVVLTDGEPADDWETQFYELTEHDGERQAGFPWYPVVLPIGVLADVHTDIFALSFPPDTTPITPVTCAADVVQGVMAFLSQSRPETLPRWSRPAEPDRHEGNPVPEEFR